jgi:hypothetical protein
MAQENVNDIQLAKGVARTGVEILVGATPYR